MAFSVHNLTGTRPLLGAKGLLHRNKNSSRAYVADRIIGALGSGASFAGSVLN